MNTKKQEQKNKKKFSLGDMGVVAAQGIVPYPILGLARGTRSGHKVSGFYLGPSGAIGAEDINTGDSHLPEVIAGGALAAIPLGHISGLNDKEQAIFSGFGGLTNAGAYLAGRVLGRKYSKDDVYSEDIHPKYVSTAPTQVEDENLSTILGAGLGGVGGYLLDRVGVGKSLGALGTIAMGASAGGLGGLLLARHKHKQKK